MMRYVVGTLLIIFGAVASFVLKFMSAGDVYIFISLGIICVGFLIQLLALLEQRREMNKSAFQIEAVRMFLKLKEEREKLQ